MHIVQRGVNRQECFLTPKDYRAYLAALEESSVEAGVAVHAYVLMTNHVHLLVTPATLPGASAMMQQLGRRFVSYFNKAHARTGTLWEGRFRSSVIATSKYLLACHRYIEMNPVRAGMVARPEDYAWSSYRANALGFSSRLVSPHFELLALGDDAVERQSRYRRIFAENSADQDDALRHACRKGAAL